MNIGTRFCFPLLGMVLGSILGSCAKNPVSVGYDWPSWRGPKGDGVSQETNWNPRALAESPRILWTADIGVGYSDVVIQANRLYAMGNMGKAKEKLAFQCLGADTGRVIWRREFKAVLREPQSTPVVDDERVYGLAADGTLRCLRTANGKVLWEKRLWNDFEARSTTHGWATSPVIEGDLLLINANSAEIALDKKTGKRRWSIADKPRAWGSFASTVVGDFQGTRCGVFLGPSTLNIVELATGKKLWSYPHDEAYHPISDPIAFDNQVFIQLLYSCSLLESAGAEPRVLWRTASFCNASYPTPVLVDGYLFGSHWPQEYFLSPDDWASMRRIELPFRCVEWKTGRVLWEKSMKNVTLTAANGKLLLLEVTGTLHIAEAAPSSYEELCSADVLGGANRPRTFATPPVLCNGRIYCRNYAGDLVCIDVSS